MTDYPLSFAINRPRLQDLALRIVSKITRHMRNSRDMKTLAELPDFLLDDMGLTRSEIPEAVLGRKKLR